MRPISTEHNHQSELELVALCKQVPLPSNIDKVDTGRYLALLPADSAKTVVIHEDGTHTVWTFKSHADARSYELAHEATA